MGNWDFVTGNNQWEIWIPLQATINGKFGFRYRQQSMGILDFVTGNNRWEIWIPLQATINGKFGFRYRQQSMGNLDFATGNNQWEIWISLQATINWKFGFRLDFYFRGFNEPRNRQKIRTLRLIMISQYTCTRIFTFVVLGKPNICLKKFEAEHRTSLCASSFSWPSSSRKTTSENFGSSSIFCQSSANVDVSISIPGVLPGR